MNPRLNILTIHQGAELYGSDRSFVSAVCALRERHPDARIDVVLPEPGPIVDLLQPYSTQITYNGRGILRKVELKARPWSTLKNMATAWLEYRRMFRTYDICYVNTVVCVSAIAALRSRRAGAYVHVREIPSPLPCRVFHALLRFSRARLIYNSAATAAAFGLDGVVIHNGVDPAAPVHTIHRAEKRLMRVVILGRVNPWKGQQFVLDALNALGRSIPVHVRIVGDVYPGYESLLDTLRQTAVTCEQTVEIEGFTDDPGAHLEWADFVLVPSIQPEPFGRVAIESFAAGRPVIAAATGGLREIVTDDVTGLLFEPGNPKEFMRALERALAMTRDKYAAMARAACEDYQRRFTVQSYKRAIADFVSPTSNSGQTPGLASVSSQPAGRS
ncbi:glycosyltransferase family 4 protein [Paraburkholderia hospita]|uniref:glycosyltransferase family 4 protein n=1 Tax=Paraburkholderia hospita TaxID=169430 RepID=UPI001374F87D|nr:glycosyltransferase family 4 protein [Paraburkholderia hospita]